MRFLFVSLILILSPGVQALDIKSPILIGSARFTIITPELIRMEYSPSQNFVDEPSLFAVNRGSLLTPEEEKQVKYSLDSATNTLTIDTGRIQFTFVDDGKGFHSGNPKARIFALPTAGQKSVFSNWSFSQANPGNLGGTRNGLDHIDLETAAAPVQEGLISTDGWYYLEDSQRLLLAGNDSWVKARDPKSDQVDGYLFAYAHDYKLALKTLTRVSGEVPLPRKYTMGSWYSRWWPYSSKDYRDIVKEFADHDFPLDMIVMDMDWHRQKDYTGLSWNRKLLPDAENLLKDFHAANLHVTLNDHPQGGVKPDEDTYNQFMQSMGEDPKSGKTLTYDAGNQRYIENLLKITHSPLEEEGVDFWWLDWMGDDQGPYNKMGWMNELYFRHSEMEKNLRGQSFSRWADWGDHRHPIHFSGDAYIEWTNLAYEIPFTASSGNVACFFWSHDIGGFIDKGPGLPFKSLNGELVARWSQFGALSAALRLHSANRSYLDKRPWKFSSEVENSMRKSFHLRSEIFPYIYSSAFESHKDSVPLIRPLYIEFPESAESYKNPQEYLFGGALLVAPIVTPGKGTFAKKSAQKVWFPEGRWFDWFTGEEHLAGSQIQSTHDLNSFPLFARGGYPIFMQNYTQRMTSAALDHPIVRIYPGISGQTHKANLYEDDGETKDYLSGKFQLHQIVYSQLSDHEAHLKIQTAMNSQKTFEIQVFSETALQQVEVNGKESANLIFDSKTHLNHLQIPATGGASIDLRWQN